MLPPTTARPFDGAVALGCIIRGETYHFEIVANESARALMDLSVARKFPLGNGILTVENEAQALVRADRKQLDKGGDAARAALALIRLQRKTRCWRLMSRADQRSAARLAIVQALYQMDVTGKGLNEIYAEFESFWIGREVEGDEYKPAEVSFFRDVLAGVLKEQREIDPLVDRTLAEGWPLKRVEAVMRAILRAGAYELKHAHRRAGARRHHRICRGRQRLLRARGSRHDKRGARPARAYAAARRVGGQGAAL